MTLMENKAIRQGKPPRIGTLDTAIMSINAAFEVYDFTFEQACEKQHLVYEAYQAALEWNDDGDEELRKTIDTQIETLIFMDCLIGMIRQELKGSVLVPREPAIWPIVMQDFNSFIISPDLKGIFDDAPIDFPFV